MKILFRILMVTALFAFGSCSKSDKEEIKNDGVKTTIEVDAKEQESFIYNQERLFDVILKGVNSHEITAPKGWNVKLEITANEAGILTVKAPKGKDIEQGTAVTEGNINIRGVGNDIFNLSLEVIALDYELHIVTFEDVEKGYMAGPTSYGDNLYPQYTGKNPAPYTGYTDFTVGLFFNTTVGGYGFASGGIAISQWNDMTTIGHMNQCSVYGKGGNNGSATFAVSYAPSFGNSGAFMEFDSSEEYVIDHLFITNNTYAVLSMTNGDGFGKKFSYEDKDWMKLTFKGIDANGDVKGAVDFYLADFRTAKSVGIIKEWRKVDLTTLGKVSKIEFSMSSSDGEGMWMNTPSYFCMDDIAIRFPAITE